MHAPGDVIVRVSGLRKQYGDVIAVADVAFDVQAGEIFGMVGPNGAGKTTTIECIEGLRRPDQGSIKVMGLDPIADGYEVRERIGIQFQTAALPPRIKVGEALDLFASFYRRSVDWRPLLDRMGLLDRSNAYVAKLSGGQRQRVFIALALINDPQLVFLDELTTGLDPQSRRSMWDLVADMRQRGKTVFLTTHFMEEAERLCDRVAIIDHGKIIALDAPRNLIASLGAESRLVFEADGPYAEDALRAVPGVVRIERAGERVMVCGHGEGMLADAINALSAAGVGFRNLRTEQSTLEDVFLAVTGREMRD